MQLGSRAINEAFIAGEIEWLMGIPPFLIGWDKGIPEGCFRMCDAAHPADIC